MTNSIQPYDKIRIINDVKATLIIHFHAPFTDVKEILVAPETILVSSFSNYDATDEYKFLPEENRDSHDILEFYKYEIPKGSFLDCSFKIATTELSEKFEVVERFDCNNLNPNRFGHLHLLASFYFDGNLREVSPEKWNSFVSDFTPLEKVLSDYNGMLITRQEAIGSIAYEIKEQINAANKKVGSRNFPKILGKVELPPNPRKR